MLSLILSYELKYFLFLCCFYIWNCGWWLFWYITCWKNNSRTLKLVYSVTCSRFRIFIFRMLILNFLSRQCLVCTSSIGFSWCKTFFNHFITKFHHINIRSSDQIFSIFLCFPRRPATFTSRLPTVVVYSPLTMKIPPLNFNLPPSEGWGATKACSNLLQLSIHMGLLWCQHKLTE